MIMNKQKGSYNKKVETTYSCQVWNIKKNKASWARR